MATAIVRNVDPGSAAERLVREWVEEALEKLSPGAVVTVHVSGMLEPLDAASEASGGRDGLWVHHSIILDALRFGGWKRLRFGFIAYEEVAHHVLALAGVPNNGDGQFFQEFFATWFQISELVMTGRISWQSMQVKPVEEGPWLIYDLGKHLGASLAGSSLNQRQVDDWLLNQRPERREARLVNFASRRLVAPLSVDEVAAAFTQWSELAT